MTRLIQNVLTVGGNGVSAFLSWRLSATNACDVTLVWKSGYESVHQYGISFRYDGLVLRSRLSLTLPNRSSKFGNERFKPRHGTAPPLPKTETLY